MKKEEYGGAKKAQEKGEVISKTRSFTPLINTL